MRRRQLVVFSLATVLAALAPTLPASAGKDAVYTGIVPGTGLGGYDPVAYFTENRPRPGEARISAIHEGVTYRFASEENRATFIAEPARYLPQYGGYCAWAVANGYTAHGDPQVWTVVDDRLYLNYSRMVHWRWERDVPGNIVKGDANWPKVLGE
jgi:YHS domain-containing protein